MQRHWIRLITLCISLPLYAGFVTVAQERQQGQLLDTPPNNTAPPPNERHFEFDAPPSNPQDGPIQLKVKKQQLPDTFLFRQLQPQLYNDYEKKTRALRESLANARKYLESLNGEPPTIQRLSAFNADTSLDWKLLQAKITPQEESFRSYQLMKDAVTELNSLSSYWQTSQKLKSTFRGTLREHEQDQAILERKLAKIQQALDELDAMESTKQDIKAEIPY